MVEALAADYQIYGLTAHHQGALLSGQIRKLQPAKAVVTAEELYQEVITATPAWAGQLLVGLEGLIELVTDPAVDVVVSALVGAVGIQPTLAALQAGKKVALANKECLVAAGELLLAALSKEKTAALIPIDSEHSAVFQCLQAVAAADLKQVHLTASGGPFRRFTTGQMEGITPEAALNHPTWQMGGKITIDSATLMNKGLEVIEAHWLFGLPYDRIKVVIHPQSVVHSFIELVDGSLLAQLVRRHSLPINVSGTEENPFSRLDLINFRIFSFILGLRAVSLFELAYAAGKEGALPTVLNAIMKSCVLSAAKLVLEFSFN